jgi:RNA recognition motif-containing protein
MSILYVGNLAFKTTAETLGSLFERVGEVIDVTIAAPEN